MPDMPALCRRLVEPLSLTLGRAVDAVRFTPDGWRVESLGKPLGRNFTHVVLATPPKQAALLIAPHRSDWAQLGLRQRMLPCWTLIGVADRRVDFPVWDIVWPPSGPLVWVIRNERKPGRVSIDQHMNVVAHASAALSETHLEALDDAVHAALSTALGDFLGQVPNWRVLQVHCWRYASVTRPDACALEPFWFDAELGLGVCGDFLGGAGVEGAWTSGNALASRIARACGVDFEASVAAGASAI